jgi:hypothetical protein
MEGQFSYQGFDLLIEPARRAATGPGCCVRRPENAPVAIHVAVLGTGATKPCAQARQAVAGPAGLVARKRAVEDFGGKLYGAVFQDELRDALQRSLTLTRAQQAGCGAAGR